MGQINLVFPVGLLTRISTSQSGPQAVQLDSITVDAVLSETYSLTSETTDNPVEQGIDITDHIRPKPRTYRLDGFVSEVPVPGPATTAYGPATQVAGDGTVFSGVSPPDDSRPGKVYRTLVAIWQNQVLLTIATAMETYDNMAMLSAPVTRKSGDGRSLHFSATFKEIRIVQSQVVSVPRRLPKTKPHVKTGGTEPSTLTTGGSLLAGLAGKGFLQ